MKVLSTTFRIERENHGLLARPQIYLNIRSNVYAENKANV
jgi:hypothetical protein